MSFYFVRAAAIAAIVLSAVSCQDNGDPQVAIHAPAKHVDMQSIVEEPDATLCDGRPVEAVETTWDDGIVQQREDIVRDDDGTPIRHGRLETFWDDGSPKLEVFFVCGTRHGPKRAWHTNGQQWQDGWYFNGRDHGTWTTYYPDGTIQQQFTMEKGTWNGPFTQWHPNGQTKLELTWVNGYRQGTERLWDEDGALRRRVDYADGVPQPMATVAALRPE